MTRLLVRIIGVVVVSGLVCSCMGSFTLTRKLYGFNDSLTGSKIVNNLVFWALVFVLPVYELAMLGDAFILNVIEFWTGKNLLALSPSDVERDEDGGLRVASGGEVFIARPVSETRVEVTRNGERVGAVELAANGALVVEDARGEVMVVPREVLAAIEPALR